MDTHSSLRLAVLAGQLGGTAGSSSEHGLVRQATAATAVRSLPKFDPYIMETYLDDLREMKRQVYDLFKFKPELLPGPELSKGAGSLQFVAAVEPQLRMAVFLCRSSHKIYTTRLAFNGSRLRHVVSCCFTIATTMSLDCVDTTMLCTLLHVWLAAAVTLPA